MTTRAVLIALFSLCLWFTFGSRGNANETEWRTWTSVQGSKIEARLVERTGEVVVLERKDGGRQLQVRLSQLSQEDRDYLQSLPEVVEPPEETGETTVTGLEAEPGVISGQITCQADERWSYRLYLPKDFHTGRQWPVWFVMSAGGGKNGKALRRYIPGADRLGCILALSVQSKNNFADSDLAIEAMADDVYERLPVIEGLGFTSGMSGGSRMAYLLAERDKRIGGVLACGSESGVYLKEADFRPARLRRSTTVYSLIGTNCFNRSEAVRSHQEFPDHFRLRFFSGRHDWAKSPYIEEGMARVYGETLKQLKGDDRTADRRRYARTMWAWTQEMRAGQPWEAASWARFLADFEEDPRIQSQAKELAGELKDDERVQLATKADKAIDGFCKKHFNRSISTEEDKKPDPAREAEAERLADKFGDLPHAELLRLLGKPS